MYQSARMEKKLMQKLSTSVFKANYFHELSILQLLLLWHLLSLWLKIFKSNTSSVTAWRQKFLSINWKDRRLI